MSFVSHEPPETFSFPGAHALAVKIRRYWKARGKHARVNVEAIDPGVPDTLYQVRSTMIGGWP